MSDHLLSITSEVLQRGFSPLMKDPLFVVSFLTNQSSDIPGKSPKQHPLFLDLWAVGSENIPAVTACRHRKRGVILISCVVIRHVHR